MNQQHSPKDEKVFNKGINSDTNKEILGLGEGVYVDAVHLRNLSQDGSNSALKKVKGEVIHYPNYDNRCFLETQGTLSTTYECMLTLEIDNHIIEVWASNDPSKYDPYMRVDGKVVLMSENFPVDLEHPLQYDKNENCVSGEFYITNNNTPPMVFSLKDLMENSGMIGTVGCTQKYFADFNINEYTVNISASLHKPWFVKQDLSTTGYNQVFGAAGVPVGSYSYCYRFVSPDGDRTSWSPITEMIPVAQSIAAATADPYFPARRSYSKDSNIASPSPYGNHIRLRIENYNGFESIEIRRDSWYSSNPIGTAPVSEIIGLMLVDSGVYAANILDKCGANEVEEVITLDEQLNQMTSIERAKSIRYFNDRLYLMNIGYASKDIEDKLEFVSGSDLVAPTIQKIFKVGHKSTFNGTHYKSNMRGDTVGFGVAVFDGNGNISYVKKIDGAESFDFPNRREEISNLTDLSSYYGTVKAATIGGDVSYTHEVFDHADAVGRSGLLSANIMDGVPLNAMYPGNWEPFSPTSQTDNSSDYGSLVNYQVKNNGGSWQSYNPRCFGLDYYSMGIAFKGVLELPSWASGFSVVQTESVRKVVAQGLGFYRLQEAGGIFGANGTKAVNKFFVYFPDLDEDTGISPDVVDELLTGIFDQYEVQLVSPMGYFSEIYSFDSGVLQRDLQADMITYCRVLKDNGEINPGGIDGIANPSGRYVGYGANKKNVPPACFPSNGNGNNHFGIVNFNEITTSSGIGKYFEVQLDESFYNYIGAGGPLDGDNSIVQNWQEPVYAINLVKKNAEVIDSNTTQYKYTGHFIKKEALVAEGTGASITVPLVSERWEDCIPRVSNHTNNGYSYLDRFVWVENAIGEKKRWLNVTFKTASQINDVVVDLAANGVATITESITGAQFEVYGIYRSNDEQVGIDNSQRGFNLVFESFTSLPIEYMVPQQGNKVYVKYDNRIPVRVFGGDTWINDSIWAVQDNEYNKKANPINDANDFRWNMPMPFNKYMLSPNIRIVKDAGNTIALNRFQLESTFEFQRGAVPSSIRQWVLMWSAETRINLSYAFNDESAKHSTDQYFPLKNYVMRPNKWKDNKFANPGVPNGVDVYNDNHMKQDEYVDAYGAEYVLWGFGGFRFRPQTNIDYSKTQNTLLLTTTPQIGFDEQTKFCTRILWSEKRPINAQYTPTVRTFPAGNSYDLSDDTGEIKFAWSAISSDKGNNLYAFTDSGFALLLVDKRIIHEINASELATVGSDIGGILNHLFLDKSVGMHDETWRSWAEYSNMIFFHNGVSAYLCVDNQLQNITDNGWKEMYLQRIAPYIGSGYSTKMSGVYNVLHKEFLMNFDKSLVPKDSKYNVTPQSLIYGVTQESVQSRLIYNFDKYLAIGNKTYGMKDSKTYELGVGNIYGRDNIESFVVGVSDQEIFYEKEFIRIRVNSNVKPERIEFFSSYEEYLNGSPSSIVDANSSVVAIKDYFGYECYIPRKSVPPHNRQQGRLVLFKIVNSENEDFTISSAVVQYKRLK
jgi:hypothetical protein